MIWTELKLGPRLGGRKRGRGGEWLRGEREAEADRDLAQSIAMAVDQAQFAATPWDPKLAPHLLKT